MSNGQDLHIEKNTTRIGLLIAVLAAAMVLTQIAGENAQTEAISRTVQTSNLWAFFQAKTIRKTILETAADDLEMTAIAASSQQDQVRAKIEKWRALAATYESEPDTGEGRRELMVRARAMDAERAYYAAQDEAFDTATGCLQIAILLASTAVITGLLWLAYLAGALGLVGAGVGIIAVLSPALIG